MKLSLKVSLNTKINQVMANLAFYWLSLSEPNSVNNARGMANITKKCIQLMSTPRICQRTRKRNIILNSEKQSKKSNVLGKITTVLERPSEDMVYSRIQVKSSTFRRS